MIAIADTAPETAVREAEYRRLLGYPRGREPEARARELEQWARDWYARHGRPWVYAREARALSLTGNAVVIEGTPFTCARLAATLREAEAGSVVLVAVSAGPELEAEAARLWLEEKPDEYFFLEIYGSAVVEHLVTTTGARLCAAADQTGLAVLPHYSPGYPDWDVADQARLLERMRAGGALPGPIEVLPSGMPRPKKSLLAVFGLTSRTERVRPLSQIVACETCSLPGCRFRRAPYGRPRVPAEIEGLAPPPSPGAAASGDRVASAAPDPPPLQLDADYSVSPPALRRWAEERLSLQPTAHGTTEARFRYEGSTCTDMGRAFRFEYAVRLGARTRGYPILEQRCAPAPGDEGHRFMCGLRNAPARLMAVIAEEKPLLGRRLDDVLTWRRAPAGPSCYCEGASREHRWGLVLETIHFALARLERELLARAAPVPQPVA